MTAFALKGLLGRKLRTALTAIAIVLGVAMVSGTFVLTDSIDQAFDSIFTDSRQGSDVVISGKSAFDLGDDTGSNAPTFPVSLLEQVRAVDGVEQAEGGVDGTANLIGDDGKAVVYGGAPNLGFSIANGDSPFNPLTLTAGAWPQADEVVIDQATADKEDFEIGETVGVQGIGPVEKLRVSGLVKFGSVSTIGGATLAGFDLATAQRLFNKAGQLDEIAVAAKPGVSVEQLIQEIQPMLPADAQVVSSSEQAAEDASDTNEFISFLRIFLLVFGGVALFVGSFVIANSLSITIAQRTREFATVRTLGASRRQVLVSILIESLVVGTLAAIDRPVPRARAREAPVLALRPRRLHAAEQRAALRNEDDRRLAARRDPRHRRREPAARVPRDACPADRRRARGCDAAPVSRFARFRVVGLAGADGARVRVAPLVALRRQRNRARCCSSSESAPSSSSSASRSSPRGSCGRSRPPSVRSGRGSSC